MRNPLPATLLLLAAACAGPGFAEDPGEEARPRCEHHFYQPFHSDFAWQVQANLPVKDMGQALDNRTGLGLGVQWTRNGTNGVAHRTRLEWNVFPEGNAVGPDALKTKASNYVLSFDRLYHFSGRPQGFYVLGGLGAVRWFVDRTPGETATRSFHTTKLAVTAGAGYRFNRAVSAEARYLVSTVEKTYDGNVFQGCLSMRF